MPSPWVFVHRKSFYAPILTSQVRHSVASPARALSCPGQGKGGEVPKADRRGVYASTGSKRRPWEPEARRRGDSIPALPRLAGDVSILGPSRQCCGPIIQALCSAHQTWLWRFATHWRPDAVIERYFTPSSMWLATLSE